MRDGGLNSQLQAHSVACKVVQPTANLTLAPNPALPGDEVIVTNTSVGPWTDAAIWISDDQGTVVAGSQTLNGEPNPVQYTIPATLLQSQSYTAHVAVQNDDYPFNPLNPGQQLSETAIPVNRTPEATIDVTPQAVLTGDMVIFSAQAEGSPSTGNADNPYSWVVTPPAGASCPDNWTPLGPGCGAVGQTPPGLLLDVSGMWTADVTVAYQHEAAAGGEYQTTASRSLTVSSVVADFDVSPANPLNTEAITLDGSLSRWQAGADVSFDWQITGPSSYSGCGDVQTCMIPADTLSPGTYTITLTLTNTMSQDESTNQASVYVADGSVQLDFSWAPSNPEIGEATLFSITGLSGSVDQVQWDFGGNGCPGYTQTTNCIPYFTDCTEQVFKYASGGQKTVSLTVTINGQQYTAQPKTITVQSSGTCSGDCTYSVSPTSLSFTSSGGNRSVSVSTGSSCSWTASSNASWISVTSGSSGTGNGTVTVSVSSNSTASSRTGTLTIAGRSVSVTQSSGSTSLDFTWSPPSPQIGDAVLFSLQGLSGSVTQAVWDLGGPGCDGDPQQSTCTPGFTDCTEWGHKYASSGEKTVTVTVTLDGGGQQPTATHTLTVQDSGSCGGGACSYSVRPTRITVPAAGAAGTIQVTTAWECTWSAVSNPSWIHVTSGSPGTGSGTVGYSVDANSGGDRAGSISVVGITVLIQQTGSSGGEDGGPMLIPAVASTQGEGGTHWKSDLRAFNPTNQQLELTMQFVPQSGDETPYPTLLYNVDPSETIWINDIMYWFTQGAPGKGALDITFDPSDQGGPLITSRTYNQTDNGTYGQLIPALRESKLVGSGDSMVIAGVEQSAAYRTNIGFVNAGETPAQLTVKLFDAHGWMIQKHRALPAMSYSQISLPTLAEDTSLSNFRGSVIVSVDEGGKVTSYGSVVDQVTGDPVLIVAKLLEDVPGEEAGPQLIPAAASLQGEGGTQWKSDLRIFNPTNQELEITIQLLPQPGDETPYPTLIYNVDPLETIWIDDVMYWFTQGDAIKGALVISFDPSDQGAPVITSKTYNQTDNGTFGQFIPPTSLSLLTGAGGRLYIPGVENSDSYRTNIGLVNTGPDGAGVTVTLIDHLGNELVHAPLGIPAGTYMQLSLNSIAAQDPDALDITGFKGTVVVQVENGGSVAAYGSVVDWISGDPVFVPATESGSCGGSTCQIAVTSPNGGESWEVGSAQAITWTGTGSGCGESVKVELVKNEQVVFTISTGTPNDGELGWQIPTSLSPDIDYRVRLTDLGTTGASDFSDGTFTLVESQAVCNDPIVLDDGSAEAWMGNNSSEFAWVEFLESFEPMCYPYPIGSVQVGLTREAGVASAWNGFIEIYDLPGPGEPPGALLEKVPISASSIPVWPSVRFYTVSLPSPHVVDSGSVYVGILWQGPPDTAVGVDQDQDDLQQSSMIFYRTSDDLVWQQLQGAFLVYALQIRLLPAN